jgi:predicted ATPase
MYSYEGIIMFTKISNFKSWAKTGDIHLAPLTVFFGANSSGKSSLLQILLLLKQTTESNDRRLVLKTGSIQTGYVNLGTPHEITHKDTTQMTLSVAWSLPHKLKISASQISIDHLAFSTTIYADTQQTFVERLSYTHDKFFVVMTKTDNNDYSIQVNVNGHEPKRPPNRPRTRRVEPQKCYGFSDEAIRFYQDTDYLSDIILEFEQQFERLYYLGPLREYPQRIYTWGGEKPTDVGLKGELAIPALLAGKDDNVIANTGKGRHKPLQKAIAEALVKLGLAHSFEAKPLIQGGIQYEVRLRRTKNSHPVLITDMGIGVSQVLPVLVLCYYVPMGSTIILEQPELHLHPSVQSALADVFIDVIKKRNIQLIIESHSEHLLRRLQRRIAEEQIDIDKTALYFCDAQNGVSDNSLDIE